ncbi:uncharacterized protein N7477_003787 [Penicillium maclennaniae]|uniref:uncharacterized protein n=1 Tax=Penicillium maclennaniae TaxID=1343394 RepID=UPI0025423D2B|nr:uncharacterized protein N7477_003787 [Penicillium maclennaniae]KAJ5678154.1 hypothetical protein N7477_003787 [Penicillium maclennaniae]
MSVSISPLRLSLGCSKSSLLARAQSQPPLPTRTLSAIPRTPHRQCALPSASSTFTTHASRMNETHEQPKRGSDLGSKPFDSQLAMNFESLAFRKKLKLLVLVMLGTSAVIETLIWGEHAWVWWKGDEGDRID